MYGRYVLMRVFGVRWQMSPLTLAGMSIALECVPLRHLDHIHDPGGLRWQGMAGQHRDLAGRSDKLL